METKMVKVLRVDAWAVGKGVWDWNDVSVVDASLTLSLFETLTEDDLLQWMIDESLISEDCVDMVKVEDDSYNIIFLNKCNNFEPIFAMEYGVHY